jgi:uncharacterized membrane protein
MQRSNEARPETLPRELRLTICLFAGFCLSLGLVFLTREPPVSTFDAQAHYFRTAQLSAGQARATVTEQRLLGGDFPRRVADFGMHQVTAGRRDEAVWVPFTNTAVYSPVNYVPQAGGLTIGHILRLSELDAYRVSCLANLMAYIAVVSLAIALAPGYSPAVVALAMVPAMIRQAASQSPDAVNFSLVALFIAAVLRASRGKEPVSIAFAALIAGLGILLCLLKPTAAVLLLLLLAVPAGRFRSRAFWGLFVLAPMCLGFLALIVWNGPYLGLNTARTLGIAADPAAQQRILFEQPHVLVDALKKQLAPATLLAYWAQNYGFILWPMDRQYGMWTYLANVPATSYLVLTMMVSALIVERPPLRSRVVLLVTGVTSFVAITSVIWLTSSQVGSSDVAWNQGRYFGTAFLLVALAIPVCGLISSRAAASRARFAIQVALLVLAGALSCWSAWSLLQHSIER